jgi:hypothetical protein
MGRRRRHEVPLPQCGGLDILVGQGEVEDSGVDETSGMRQRPVARIPRQRPVARIPQRTAVRCGALERRVEEMEERALSEGEMRWGTIDPC